MEAKINLVARVILGMIFLVFSLNFFFPFLPQPPLEEAGMNMMVALMGTGYFMVLLKITELISSLLVLTGRYTPLGILLLAPIVVQIFCFHLFLAPSGILLAVVLVLLEGYLGYAHFGKFRHLFFPAAEEN